MSDERLTIKTHFSVTQSQIKKLSTTCYTFCILFLFLFDTTEEKAFI